MSDAAREWADRARKAQEAISDLGAGPPAGRLTDHDRRVIARARALAESADLEAVRGAAADPGISTYAEAFGVARVRLGDLLAIIDWLDGHAAAQITEENHG